MRATVDSVEIQFQAGKPWRTLWNLYWPERRSVYAALITYLFKFSPVLILPVVTANLTDIIAHRGTHGLKALWINAIVGAVAIVQNIPSAMLYVDFLSRAVRNVEIRLRAALTRRLQMLSIGYYNRTDTGTLQMKVLRDVESIEMMSRQIIDTGEFAVVSVLVALFVTAVRMPIFVPVFILYVPLIWLLRRLMVGRLQRYNQTLRRELESMNSLVLGMLNMIPITRAHAVEDWEINRVETQFDHVRTAARIFDKTNGVFGAIGWVALMLFNIAGLTVGAWLSYNGVLSLTPGDLVLIAFYFNMILQAVNQLNTMIPVIARGFDGLRSIGEVLECPDIEENRGKRPIEKLAGDFVFDNVGFTYREHSADPPALHEINLHVAAGEIIGIGGPSGSGKSTLAGLIMGFHRPTTGRIMLDGVDVNALDLRTYRRHLAVVSQQTILFDGSLRENITYGVRDVADSNLRRAIADANAEEFIKQLPHGLDSHIGSRGVQLSGGQRQRVAIARALLRNPKILILDEATSALDHAGEAVVVKALKRLVVGRTTFIIAHRPAILSLAGRILTLDNGRLLAP